MDKIKAFKGGQNQEQLNLRTSKLTEDTKEQVGNGSESERQQFREGTMNLPNQEQLYAQVNEETGHEQVTIDLSDDGGDDDSGERIINQRGINRSLSPNRQRIGSRLQRNEPSRGIHNRLAQESDFDNDIQEEDDGRQRRNANDDDNNDENAQGGPPGGVPGRTENYQEANPNCIKKMKLFIACLAIFFLLFFLFVAPMPLTHVECVQDTIQDSLQSHYDYFQKNSTMRNGSLIIFGALTDFLLIVFLLQWVHYGGSWRFVQSLCLTYALRLVLCKLFYMRQPIGGDLWSYPGWYSLTVQYGTSNDYYFNPVLAICTQLFFEYRQLGQGFFKWMCLVALIGDFYLSLCLKGHYFIDNYGGIVLGYQIWSMTNNWLSYYIDVRLFGLTLHERFNRGKGIDEACQKCSAPINEWIQQRYSRSENGEASADGAHGFDNKKSPVTPRNKSTRPT